MVISYANVHNYFKSKERRLQNYIILMAVWIKVLGLMDKSISLDYQGIHLLSVCSELKQTWRNLLLGVCFASIALIAKLHHYFDY